MCHSDNHITRRMVRRIPGALLLFLLVFLFSGAWAQKEKKPVVSGVKARVIAQFPFTTFTGGVAVIRAKLDGYPDTLSFILDTGSGGISLDSQTCIRLKILPELTDKMIIGIGGMRRLYYVKNQGLTIGELHMDSLNFHIGDYDVLSSVYGGKIDGIIGYSFFSRYVVKIDYDSNQVYVYNKGSMKFVKGGFFLRPSLVSLPVQSGHLKDEREVDPRFYFDTGAGLCLLLSSEFLQDSALFDKGKKVYATEAQGMGGKANMQVTTIREFRLGPYRFKNMPTHIFVDEYNITSYPALAGLIGNDVLRRFNIIMNYEKRLFYLTPNSHFRDPFDYSYTGLGLYWDDGEIRVGDVMKGSPAEDAGFKIDDVVIGVNDNKSQNLQQYKSMMQNIGEKVRFQVIRPAGMVELNMRIKSIM